MNYWRKPMCWGARICLFSDPRAADAMEPVEQVKRDTAGGKSVGIVTSFERCIVVLVIDLWPEASGYAAIFCCTA